MIKKSFLFVSIVLLVSLFLPAAVQAARVLKTPGDVCDANLFGWWKLDGTGATVVDSKGGDNNGVIAKTTLSNLYNLSQRYNSGYQAIDPLAKFDFAMTFNTSNTVADARIDVPMAYSGLGGDTHPMVRQGTIAMWAKLEPFPDKISVAIKYFAGWQGTWGTINSNVDRVQLFYTNVGGDPTAGSELCVGMGNSNKLDTSIKHLNVGDWYHVALTWIRTNDTTKSGTYKAYLNGIDLPSGFMAGTAYAPGTYQNLQRIADSASIGNNMSTNIRKTEGGVETLQQVGFWDRALTRADICKLSNADSNQAWNPKPADTTVDLYKDQGTTGTLTWGAGDGGTKHQLYFSDVFADVNERKVAADKGLLTSASWVYGSPTLLKFNTNYFWRVDEKNAAEVLTASGPIWKFNTVGGYACVPIPYDGQPCYPLPYEVGVLYGLDITAPTKIVQSPVILKWRAGDVSGVTHDVYFGLDSADVNDNARTGTWKGPTQAITATSYTPPSVMLSTKYYWRVDEVRSYPTMQKGYLWDFITTPIYYVDDFQEYIINNTILRATWRDKTGADALAITVGDGSDTSVAFQYNPAASPYYAGIKRSVPTPQGTGTNRDYTFNATGKTLRVSYKVDPNTNYIYAKLWSGASSDVKVKAATNNNTWQTVIFNLTDFGNVKTNVTAVEVGEGNAVTGLDPHGTGSPWVYFDDVLVQTTEYTGELVGDISVTHHVDYNDVDLLHDTWMAPAANLVQNPAFNQGTWTTTPPNPANPNDVNNPDIVNWPKYWYLYNDTAQTGATPQQPEEYGKLRLDNSDATSLTKPCATIDLDMPTTHSNDVALCQVIDVNDYNKQSLLVSFMHKGNIYSPTANVIFEYRPYIDGCSSNWNAGPWKFRRIQRGGKISCADCFGAMTWDWEPYTHIMDVNVAQLDENTLYAHCRYLHLHFRLYSTVTDEVDPEMYLKIDTVTVSVVDGNSIPAGDINWDNKVDMGDFAALANNWLKTQPSIP